MVYKIPSGLGGLWSSEVAMQCNNVVGFFFLSVLQDYNYGE